MSERRSLWGLRLLAVGLALLAWFVATGERRERRTEITFVEPFINYTTSEQMMILRSVEKVRVGIRGTSSQIQKLNRFQVSVGVDLRNAEKGALEVNLTQRDVVLPEGLEVDSIDPQQFVVELDRVVQQLHTVEPNLVGEPAAGAMVSRTEVLPPQVLISGPESLMTELQSLKTSPVSLNGHALDFEERAQVVSPDPKIQVLPPVVVTVRVRLQIPTVGAPR